MIVDEIKHKIVRNVYDNFKCTDPVLSVIGMKYTNEVWLGVSSIKLLTRSEIEENMNNESC